MLVYKNRGDNISYAFSNILSPEKLYILYTSKYIISPLNYISFNSKNIFLKTIDSRHELVYNKEKKLERSFYYAECKRKNSGNKRSHKED